MLEPVDGLPIFIDETAAEAVVAACDGRGDHVPQPATPEGLAEAAREVRGADFPRGPLADILAGYCREIGAPAAAVENASRVAAPGALVVTTGQQPVAAGGPLYVLYKALTAVRLAREAESSLGLPVVPVFWNASEDHDLDEAGVAWAPARSGETLKDRRLRVDLERWRGMPLSAVGPDEGWRGPLREWIAALPAAGEIAWPSEVFAPREGERWSAWFSRILLDLLGPEGLVVTEPAPLRRLAAPIFAGAVRGWREIDALVRRSAEERAGRPGSVFAPLEGPPVFLEQEGFRRRVLAREGRLWLRGTDVSFAEDELACLAEGEPERFSAHAALRPVLQNAVMPVVAAVLGPGEILYHEELFRFHRSPLGAGRRMPPLWPRLSATVINRKAESTIERFGLLPNEVFLAEDELVSRFTPPGNLGRRVAESGRAASEAIRAFDADALALDPTLRRPLEKTLSTVGRAFEALRAKVEAAEARVRGFAPERLRDLASWVRPGGRPQERVFAFASVMAALGRDLPGELLGGLDCFDRRHRLLRIAAKGS